MTVIEEDNLYTEELLQIAQNLIPFLRLQFLFEVCTIIGLNKLSPRSGSAALVVQNPSIKRGHNVFF